MSRPQTDGSCCNGTGFADYAAVPCPNPRCPVPSGWTTPDPMTGCPCGPMPSADGYVWGCPVHDPRTEETR